MPDATDEVTLRKKWDQIGERLGVEQNVTGAYIIEHGELRTCVVREASSIMVATTTKDGVVNGPGLTIPGLINIDSGWLPHDVRFVFEIVPGFRVFLDLYDDGVYILHGPNPNPQPHF